MRPSGMINAVAERLHYLLLVVFCLASNIFSTNGIFRILAAVTAVYIIAFELYGIIKKRNARRLSHSFIELLNLDSQKRLISFPIPVVIAAKNGDVLWYNDPFTYAVEKTDLSDFKSVYSFSRDILNRKTSDIKFNGKYFTVITDRNKINGKDMAVLYLFDITEYRRLQHDFLDQKPVVANIIVDNYDELFLVSRESEKSSSMALIDNVLTEWAQSVHGILRKTDKDSYLFIFRCEYLSAFRDNRFNILDKIRALKLSSVSSPTVSIGVGYNAESFADNEEHARIALDMALSRGGDQAAIHSSDGFEFYGGLSVGIEKQNKVKARSIASRLISLFADIDTVLIMGHRFADFDSLGACVGMARIALNAKKKVGIVYNGDFSLADKVYKKLIKSEEIASLFLSPEDALIAAGSKTAVAVVDTNRAAMTEMPKLLEFAEHIILIDHHRKSVDSIDKTDVCFHEPNASSSCEMVAELMQFMNVSKVSPTEAESMLAGIFLDTKNFIIRTSVPTFNAASFLKKCGANTVNVRKLFQVDMDSYHRKTEMVSSALVYRNTVAIAGCEAARDSGFRIVAGQAADEMLTIDGVQASFTLFGDGEGNVNISGRSFGAVNVQLIAEKLGGGGHQTMAGAQLKNTDVQGATVLLKAAIDEYINESNINSEKAR